ncbi:20892_t:CDS:1, partial [Gigaspora rosea]
CGQKHVSANVLLWREGRHEETCPCTFAVSEFNSTVVGIIIYSQDICGETTIVILLKSGFKPGHHYDFLITDDCGKFLRNMTADLKAMFAGDGTTPFKAKLDDINLNCDNNGVLKCLHSQAC